MGRRWDIVFLVLIMIVLFWLRMQVAFSTDSLSYDSYLTVRQVEHIIDTGKPLQEDPLSSTGQVRVGSPIFEYLLAGLVMISDAMYKIFSNLFMVLILIPVYFLAKQFTKSNVASLISVILAGTGPAVFSAYLNTPSPIPLAVFIFLTILAMLHNPNKYLFYIISLMIFLTFLHPMSFILVLSLLVIIILLRLEGFGVDKRVNELFFFTLILSVWFHVLIYKPALFEYGIGVIWQNLPAKYAALQFSKVTFLKLLYGLGVITFLFGVIGIYNLLFETRMKNSFSVIGPIIAVFSLMLLKMIELRIGLFLISTLLAVMAGYGLFIAVRYLSMTKAPWISYPLGIFLTLLFVFTAILPAIVNAQQEMKDSPSLQDVEAFRELSSKVPRGVQILTTVKEAAAVQYFGQRRTVTDDDFLMLKNVDELVKDIDEVYTAHFSTSIVNKAEKLGFTHILLSRYGMKQYGRERIQVDDPLCLSYEFLSNEVRLYRVRCRGVQ